ncbi:MAG: hypothetical protein VKP63_10285 [Cyanobacteriota bacterium]|nr:hypothetical protein [Cyanobacteriota bacterium]
MQRNSFPWFWVALAAFVLLLPGPARRVLLDVIGGMTLILLLLPFLIAGIGVLAWKVVSSRLNTCGVCGTTSFGTTHCPACGSPLADQASGSANTTWSTSGERALEAKEVTIDVESVDVPANADEDSRQSP